MSNTTTKTASCPDLHTHFGLDTVSVLGSPIKRLRGGDPASGLPAYQEPVKIDGISYVELSEEQIAHLVTIAQDYINDGYDVRENKRAIAFITNL